jgi:predicted transcriptional regulator
MRQLGPLEAAVMQRLWEWGRPASVRMVLDDLGRDRDIAYTTVMTVLDNLHGKGLVRREKDGRAYRYDATMTREQHTATLLEEVLASSADREGALLHFVGQMSNDEIFELRAALARLDDGGA